MSEDRLSPAGASRYIAEKWGYVISAETIRRWVKRGGLPAVRTPGGYILIATDDIDVVHRKGETTTLDNDRHSRNR